MRHLRTLAASSKPLWIAIVDTIRAMGGSFARRRTTHLDRTEDDQLHLDLDEDGDEDSGWRPVETPVLHPADATAAVLLGRAFEGSRDVLARLRDPDMVLVIEVSSSELVKPTRRILRKFVLGKEKPVLDGNELTSVSRTPDAGVVIIFAASGDTKAAKSSYDETDVADAVQACASIIAITAAPKDLPPTLLDLAEHRIVLSPIDAEVVLDVIAAVTGRRPDFVDEALGRRVTIEALSIAVRADLGARRSLARLQRLVGAERKSVDGLLLSEMHGLGRAKDVGLEIANALRAYAAGQLSWADCPRGLLISGPPGVAKTSYAAALAREASVNFIATSYAQWQSNRDGHLGAVTAAIRKVFLVDAPSQRPCVVLWDECDAVPARGRSEHDSWWSAINGCLLECLDGYERREGIFVVAVCNDASKLDPALVRAGRLDQHVVIPLPDLPGLIGIFRTHLGHDLAGIDLRSAALAARGHTGADVERWVRIARKAARDAKRALSASDLLDAIREGEPELPAELRRLFAYHEAGHAIMHRLLGTADPVSLSIGADGGVTESELNALHTGTRSQLERLLAAILGGRAAEHLVFGEAEVTIGSAGSRDSDLARATRLAIRMETQFGLGGLGLVSLSSDLTDTDLLRFDRLRTSVQATIDGAFATALDALGRNRAALDALAAALFNRGYLDRQEIETILAPSSLSPASGNQTTILPTQMRARSATPPTSIAVTVPLADDPEPLA